MFSKIVNDLMYRKKFRTRRNISDTFMFIFDLTLWLDMAVNKVPQH